MSVPSSPVGVHLSSFLAAPDVVLPAEGAPSSLRLATSAAVGLVGMGAFGAVVGLGMAQVPDASLSDPLAILRLPLTPVLAVVLSFPPLYLVSTLMGRTPGLLRLVALGISGLTVAGVVLGAASPLLLLYALTGAIDFAFVLLALGFGLLATWAGARATLANRLRAGDDAPGRLVLLAHYAITLWTCLVLSFHLA